ncbi:hypothetical protein I7I50_12158 [Histoplasma capsulatum G186AR]|uniref:Uncharacterized protein n=1 Tax=Ajellomyces capsulatus TaxID=5037 RepID=A0A8H7YDJ4_AJECA|nr:hypothetical protein I7I52_11530 [Histoplasma capsulatum]QSS70504.1 hypothetical protein I7I50_12158 [Histoplasma capsulatum G186AR]
MSSVLSTIFNLLIIAICLIPAASNTTLSSSMNISSFFLFSFILFHSFFLHNFLYLFQIC